MKSPSTRRTAQGAAPVAEGAGDTEQRIRLTVPGLPRGNLTVAVLKSRLQMHGGAMFVKDDKTRHKAPNEHIFNKGAIKRAELLDAWRRFMDKPSRSETRVPRPVYMTFELPSYAREGHHVLSQLFDWQRFIYHIVYCSNGSW